MRATALWVVTGLVLGCGSPKPQTSSAKGESEPSPASSWEPAPLPTDGAIGALGGIKGPDAPWDGMSYEEKEWYMIGNVHVIMRQVFQTFDKAKYEGEKFECVPCHGDNAKERKYAMPNPQLSAVPAYGSEDWRGMENARIVKFMSQRVNPAMATLLGEKVFDPKTGEGFGCWGCHPKQ